MTQINLDRNLEITILSALRYAIPRGSYCPEIVAQVIEENWDKFTPHCKKCIHEDIEGFYGESFAHKAPWDRIMSLKIDDKKSL